MNFVLQPWQFFFLILAGWINREQRDVIEFQNARIRGLMEEMGRKRILLTGDQKRVLAVKQTGIDYGSSNGSAFEFALFPGASQVKIRSRTSVPSAFLCLLAMSFVLPAALAEGIWNAVSS